VNHLAVSAIKYYVLLLLYRTNTSLIALTQLLPNTLPTPLVCALSTILNDGLIQFVITNQPYHVLGDGLRSLLGQHPVFLVVEYIWNATDGCRHHWRADVLSFQHDAGDTFGF